MLTVTMLAEGINKKSSVKVEGDTADWDARV